MYVAGGVAVAYYASVWNSGLDGCDLERGDPCSAEILTAFGSILAVSSLVTSNRRIDTLRHMG